MTQLSQMGKEALCSALYNMPFSRFLGEVPDNGTEVAWFLLSRNPKVSVRQDPHVMRVAVFEVPDMEGMVGVRAEWLNLSGAEILRCEQTFHIPTLAITEAVARVATEDLLVRLLAIFSDVCGETGVAGPPDKVAPESAYDEEDDEEDEFGDAL